MSKERIVASIDLGNIEYNLDESHALVTGDAKMLAVIKANGYGHGAVKIAKRIESRPYLHGFAVATAEEAFALRTAGIKKPILILGYTFEEDYGELIRQEIELTVFRTDTARALSLASAAAGKCVKVHLAVDTGMSRIGVTPDENGVAIAKEIAKMSGLTMEGVMTHFARADETDKCYAKAQFERFMKFIVSCEKEGITYRFRHCANSASILELGDYHLDLVRLGISLYGLKPSSEVRIPFALKPAMSLRSRIVHVKEVPEGTQISYGGTFVTKGVTRVATVPVGYGDGYPRTLTGKGDVLIRGRRAPILGRVCMDQMMVDVTSIPEASMLDEVVLLGRQGEEEITAEELGDLSGRFNYELVCDISERVPRVYTG